MTFDLARTLGVLGFQMPQSEYNQRGWDESPIALYPDDDVLAPLPPVGVTPGMQPDTPEPMQPVIGGPMKLPTPPNLGWHQKLLAGLQGASAAQQSQQQAPMPQTIPWLHPQSAAAPAMQVRFQPSNNDQVSGGFFR